MRIASPVARESEGALDEEPARRADGGRGAAPSSQRSIQSHDGGKVDSLGAAGRPSAAAAFLLLRSASQLRSPLHIRLSSYVFTYTLHLSTYLG